MDREAEVRRLNAADKHIAKGEMAITRQRAILAKVEAHGHDASQYIKQLHELEAALTQIHKHREDIIRTIEQIDTGQI